MAEHAKRHLWRCNGFLRQHFDRHFKECEWHVNDRPAGRMMTDAPRSVCLRQALNGCPYTP
jgi:hypothetical protein